jgi:hypothetical protein
MTKRRDHPAHPPSRNQVIGNGDGLFVYRDGRRIAIRDGDVWKPYHTKSARGFEVEDGPAKHSLIITKNGQAQPPWKKGEKGH